MKRIVKKGVIPANPSYYFIAKCPKCECKFTYEKEDILNEVKSKYPGEDPLHSINCPFCDHKFETKKHDNYDEEFEDDFRFLGFLSGCFVGFMAGLIVTVFMLDV